MNKIQIFAASALALILIVGSLFLTLQDTIGGPEAQLREEYNTQWADSTDEQFNGQGCQTLTPSTSEMSTNYFDFNSIKEKKGCTYVNVKDSTERIGYYLSDKFKILIERNDGRGADLPRMDGNSITRGIAGEEQSFTIPIELVQVPVGSEVVYIVSASASVNSQKSSEDQAIRCTASGVELKCNSRNCPATVMKLIPKTLEKGKYTVQMNGFDVGAASFKDKVVIDFGCNLNTAKWGFRNIAGSMNIDYIGSKSQFSCDLSSDEVWVQESFSSEFDINDLQFLPTKFCKETRPFLLRDIKEGETAIKPDPSTSFNTGKSIKPNSDGQIIVVNYATYFVNGVTNKCAVNEANVKVNGKWVCQSIIKPVEVLVQCQTDADCPQPLKNSCPSYFKGCENKFCKYDDSALNAPQCKNEVVTIVKEQELVNQREIVLVEGEKSFAFPVIYPSRSFVFGNEVFNGITDYSCDIDELEEGTYYSFPNPSKSCYQNLVTFMGQSYSLKDGETIKVNDFLSFTMLAGGNIRNDEDGEFDSKRGLGATYIFNIKNPFEIQIDDASEVLKDSEKEIQFTVKNNLPDGKALVKVNQKVKKTGQIIKEQRIEKEISAGENLLSAKAETSNLGINSFTIQVFYKVDVNGKETLVPSDVFTVNYNVVDELSNSKEFVIVEKEASFGGVSLLTISIGVLILIMVGLIVTLIWRRR